MDTETVYLGYTEASFHMTRSPIGVYNIRHCQVPVQMRTGKKIIYKMMGDKKLTVVQKDRREFNIILEDVVIIPEL